MRRQKIHIINRIHKPNSTLTLLALMVFALSAKTFAQHAPADGLHYRCDKANEIELDFFVGDIVSKHFSNDFDILSTTAANGLTHDPGKPMLPVYRQIICIPDSGSFTINISHEERQLIAQSRLGSSTPLAPAAPPTPKNSLSIDYTVDSITYTTDAFYGDNVLRLEPIGQMRGYRLAKLTISPIRYNPVSQIIDLCSHLTATITFARPLPTSQNPMLPQSLTLPTLKSKEYYNHLIPCDEPYTYLIVAPPHFRRTLQPLVSWKRQEGFIVDEYYPTTATRDAIRTHLKQLYDNATPNHPAPLFILLVGDMQEIPVWPARYHIPGIDVHRTDLYYAEYTGDFLPDALLGRISTSDTTTLEQIITKTICYEQFSLSDSNYLSRSLLVAGKESTPPAPTVTNGQINYLKKRLLQHDSQHDTICYYNPGSDTMVQQIMAHLQQGVGLVNYTAHCTTHGWRNPTLSNNNIDTLPLANAPFVSINNCCRVNNIDGDCFGEHLLRKYPGGAVGVIGASNETLWEEDYYWSIGGNGDPSLDPQYTPSAPGAFDRFFHTNGETTQQQAFTQSQIVMAGNWAVTASGSPYDAFYWEIYSLLGDPSLMPYIGIPKQQQLEIDSITLGDTDIKLRGTPGARIAATLGDTLYGICTIGSDSSATLNTLMPAPNQLTFTATKQFHRPLQQTVSATPSPLARLAATSITLRNLDNDTITQLTLLDTAIVTVNIRNLGQSTAENHNMLIRTAFPYADTLHIAHIASLAPFDDTAIVFIIFPQKNSNEYILTFESADTSTYLAMQKKIDLLAPQINISDPTLSCNGQTVTTLVPSTTYDIQFSLINHGLGKAKELHATLDSNYTLALGDINANDTANCAFTFTTPDAFDSLTLTLVVTHRADTLSSAFTFYADSNLSIRQPDSPEPDIAVWPNPAKNSVTFSGITEPTIITVYDIYGRIIEKIETKNNTTIQYSTDKLRCGIYSIAFSSKESINKPRVTKKLIIAH